MPVKIPAAANEPYRPSNGTEGEMFMAKFCRHCVRDQDEDNGCEIIMRSMCFDLNDEEYPSEWRYDEGGEPYCSAFSRKFTGDK